MRLGPFALLVTLLAPGAALAQGTLVPERSWLVPGFARMPGDGWQQPDPLAKIGLPLPPIGLQPRVDPDYPQRSHRRARYAPSPVWVVVVPQYLIGAPVPVAAAVAPQPDPAQQVPLQGSLVLHVKPDDTEVFVDGYYVGAAVDLGVGGAFLEAGPHRIDLSAPGYEAVAFDVKIAPNQSIVLRRELKQLQALPPALPATRTPVTFYLIPGCYAGNVPPIDAGLPATCDISRTIVVHN